MKLNATAEMMPVTWQNGKVHPLPQSQTSSDVRAAGEMVG